MVITSVVSGNGAQGWMADAVRSHRGTKAAPRLWLARSWVLPPWQKLLSPTKLRMGGSTLGRAEKRKVSVAEQPPFSASKMAVCVLVVLMGTRSVRLGLNTESGKSSQLLRAVDPPVACDKLRKLTTSPTQKGGGAEEAICARMRGSTTIVMVVSFSEQPCPRTR
jgi:hypothetical protein